MELKPEKPSMEEGRKKQADGWMEKALNMNRCSPDPLGERQEETLWGEHKRDHEAPGGNA